MQSQKLSGQSLKVGYSSRTIIENIDIEIPENRISVIIGANGCGKSTLLKTMSRLIKPKYGQIFLNEKNIDIMSSTDIAKTIGLLPQTPIIPSGITVYDLVLRGRFPYRKPFRGLSEEDYASAREAMEMMKITDIADRFVDELSGGQRQRVWIALSLCQQTDILFLDEPTTYLDITYQVEILETLKEINRKKGTTIVMVLHDINLSARYSDYIFAMKNGNIVAKGEAKHIITPELMKKVYGLDCIVLEDPISKSPYIIPKGGK